MAEYKLGKRNEMTPELWQAKKVVDSTLHPGGLLPTLALAPFSQKYVDSTEICGFELNTLGEIGLRADKR